MRVDARDPLVLNSIRNQVSRLDVQKLSGAEPVEKVKAERRVEGREEEPYLDREGIEEAVRMGNETAEVLDVGIRFKLHEDSGRYQVLIVDRRNNEVIKEIPPEKLLALVARIQEMIGLLIDEKR